MSNTPSPIPSPAPTQDPKPDPGGNGAGKSKLVPDLHKKTPAVPFKPTGY